MALAGLVCGYLQGDGTEKVVIPFGMAPQEALSCSAVAIVRSGRVRPG